MTHYITRLLEPKILESSSHFPVILVTGPRQTGKTTLLQEIKEEGRHYVSLDSMPARILAREDPELFLQRYAPPVIIDEIQYAPELLSAIKISCDTRRENGMYWLTGSQQFELMRGVTESLAGRVAIVTLNGLSSREIDGRSDDTAPFLPPLLQPKQSASVFDETLLFERIFRGSYPALVSDTGMDTELYYSSYVQTYLERDIRELSQVGNLETFYTFLKVMAGRTGSTLNMSDIARDCAVSVPTVKQWISLLCATSIVYLLRPWHSNHSSRLIKSPKFYFLDTGLCSYLAGYGSARTLSSGPLRGSIFETWCVSEILKSWWYALREPPAYYYRDKDGAEIDVLFDTDGSLYPVEIKLGASPKKDWIKHFSVLDKAKRTIGPGAVLCLCQDVFPLDRNNSANPVGWM